MMIKTLSEESSYPAQMDKRYKEVLSVPLEFNKANLYQKEIQQS
jgi:hypothetical protein